MKLVLSSVNGKSRTAKAGLGGTELGGPEARIVVDLDGENELRLARRQRLLLGFCLSIVLSLVIFACTILIFSSVPWLAYPECASSESPIMSTTEDASSDTGTVESSSTFATELSSTTSQDLSHGTNPMTTDPMPTSTTTDPIEAISSESDRLTSVSSGQTTAEDRDTSTVGTSDAISSSSISPTSSAVPTTPYPYTEKTEPRELVSKICEEKNMRVKHNGVVCCPRKASCKGKKYIAELRQEEVINDGTVNSPDESSTQSPAKISEAFCLSTVEQYCIDLIYLAVLRDHFQTDLQLFLEQVPNWHYANITIAQVECR